jgi:hypothetical protein
MSKIERVAPSCLLSELYAQDCPDAVLLTEYPSSNSDATRFQNRSKYIIHDPSPPPPRELLKVLGPHHLMWAWGKDIPVCSEVAPPAALLEHWRRVLGDQAVPHWRCPEDDANFITLFPHQSLPDDSQVISPKTYYPLHSKEVIEKIDCPQAAVLSEISAPCIVKLTHGYAGLSNFFVREDRDADLVLAEIQKKWNNASYVINSIIEDIRSDFGVQFYLRKNGAAVWLGFTQQRFDESGKWSGGCFSAEQQERCFDELATMVLPAAAHLHAQGYFGVVGIDVVTNGDGQQFLVDVNPRLTGITPFLMASRMFADQGLGEGIYFASFKFGGSLAQLIERSESFHEKEPLARVVVLSAWEDPSGQFTTCHLSITSHSQSQNQAVLNQIAAS